MDGAEQGHDPQINGRDPRQAKGDPGQMADEDVDGPERGGQHGVVGPLPLDGAQSVRVAEQAELQRARQA